MTGDEHSRVSRIRAGARRLSGGLQPRRRRVRVLGVLGGVGLLFLGYLVVGFFSLASPIGGWLPAAAVFLPSLLLITAAGGLGRWPFAVALAAGAALLLGAGVYRVAPPGDDRLAAVASEVGVPASWELVDEESQGNTWCLWNDCPERQYTYRTTDTAEVAARAMTTRLSEAGWAQEPLDRRYQQDPVGDARDWSRGRWNLVVNVDRPSDAGWDFPPPVAPGLTKVTVVVHDNF